MKNWIALSLLLVVGCASIQTQQMATTQPVTYTQRFDAMQKDLNFARSFSVFGATIAGNTYQVAAVKAAFDEAQQVLDKSRAYAQVLDGKGQLDEEKLTELLNDVTVAIGKAK